MEKLYYCTANYSYGQNDKIGSETILESKIREVLVTKVIEISLLATVGRFKKISTVQILREINFCRI